MGIKYLKKAKKTATTDEDNMHKIVSTMLNDIEKGSEEKAKEYAENLDKYTGNIVVTTEEIKIWL